MVVQEEELGRVRPTRLAVQVPAGSAAAKTGLVFLAEGPVEEEWVAGLSRYDGWKEEDYQQWKEGTAGGGDDSGLVAFFEFSEETYVHTHVCTYIHV